MKASLKAYKIKLIHTS